MNLSLFIVYILFFIIYLEEDYYYFLKRFNWIYKSKDRMEKINKSVKISGDKPSIIISHS